MTAKGESAMSEKKFPVSYRVLNVEPWTFLDPRGNPTAGFRVTFTFGEGIVDWVDVPEKLYNAQYVQGVIEERITKHAEIFNLGL
jgi:hypothetical protein